jgi:alpha-D-xyloside xylohydrolase
MIRRNVAVLALILASLGANGARASESLESSALRLEVSTNPYSYRVLERVTGDVLVAETGGISFTENRYTVKSVTDVAKSGDTLRIIFRLNGISGPAEAEFRFISPQVLQATFTFHHGIPGEIREEFSDQGEHYYGIWEMPISGALDNRSADQDFLGMRPHPGVNYSSARAPFYATSRKYGIYVESTGKGHYSIARDGKTSFSFFDTQLRYDIIYGPSYAQIFSRYNAIAGPPVMPPTWAFSSIWWRDDHHDDLRRVKNAQEKLIEDADRLRQLHIPAGSMWLDRPYGTGEMGWGNMDFDASFPDPPKMIQDMRERGMNLLLWIANRAWNQLQEQGEARQYLFYGKGSAADVRNPAAYEWFKDELNAYVRMGIKGYKIDRGEEDELPLSVENLNAILFPKLAAEGLEQSNGNDFFMFTRNVNDTARRYTAVWNGDPFATFLGLETTVKTGLRCGAIDFPMWGSDTGGYNGNPDKELFARWIEVSAFSPMMEVLLGPKRTIWDDYDEELVKIAQNYAAMHHDLIPYSRSYLYQARQNGMPLMRALVFAYPEDASLTDTWNEYLYGTELLVAPVTTAGATRRDVYLPEGQWLDYNDKSHVYEGKKTVDAAAPLGTVPLFVREGAIVPRGDIVRVNNKWDTNWSAKLRIEIFPSAKTSSEFSYYTGEKVEKITAVPTGNSLTIQLGELGAPGRMEVYCRNVRDVSVNGKKMRKGGGYDWDEKAHRLTIPFQGATKIELTGAESLFAQ